MTAMRAWLVTASIVAHVVIIRLASGSLEIQRLEAKPELDYVTLELPSPLVQPEWRRRWKPVVKCSGCVCHIVKWRRPDLPQKLCVQVAGRILCLPPWDTPPIPWVGEG